MSDSTEITMLKRPRMQRFFDLINSGMFQSSLVFGFLVAFVTSILRLALKERRTSLKIRVCEALLCSFLATACTQVAVTGFGLSQDFAMPIAIFVGFLGSEFVNSILIGVIKYKGYGKHLAERNHGGKNGESRPD